VEDNNFPIPYIDKTPMPLNMKFHTRVSATAACCALFATPLHAAVTFSSDSFNGLASSDVDLTGLEDWGYVSTNGAFMDDNPTAKLYSSLDNGSGTVITTTFSSSTIGEVRLTEDGDTLSATNIPGVTFGGTESYGSFRNFGTAEDAFTIEFNDLGVGDFVITLYVGHTNTSRIYDMDFVGTGNAGGTTVMTGNFSTYTTAVGGMLAYTITGSTTDALDDVTLSLGNAAGSGGSGAGFFPGYTVDFTPIPEPSVACLAGFGVLALLRRRR
jgi:hypothetical protein